METKPHSDALTTAEVLEKVLSGAVVKTSLPLGRQLPLAFLAGLYIGLGGLFATLFLSDASLSFAAQRFCAGAVFSLCTALPLCCERGSFSLCAAAVLRLFAARAAGLRARIFHRVRAIFKLCAKYKI